MTRALLTTLVLAAFATTAYAEETASEEEAMDNLTAAYSEDGRYFTEDDVPTFNFNDEGQMDWPTYSGFRRYHSECHVCHGPEGEGSSYAPALKASAIDMDFYDFLDVVTNGRKVVRAGGGDSVMPAFGENPNVMCYINDIYVYLKARGAEALPRGRPGAKEPKSDVIREDENACLGS